MEIPLLQFSMISSVAFPRKRQKERGRSYHFSGILSTAKISYQRNKDETDFCVELMVLFLHPKIREKNSIVSVGLERKFLPRPSNPIRP